ncbi:hypothetical protein [Lawsonella clevelandensis]|nr:hypothetical protein [Lawsonella clevelandensis]
MVLALPFFHRHTTGQPCLSPIGLTLLIVGAMQAISFYGAVRQDVEDDN